MHIRYCPCCDSESATKIFDFDYEYSSNILNVDPLLMRMIGFEKDKVSDLVECNNCKVVYIKTDFEVDIYLDEYYSLLTRMGQQRKEENTDQGKPKTWSDKIRGKELINKSVLDLLRAYSRNKRNDPVGDSKIKVLDFGCGWGNWLSNLENINIVEAYGYDINQFKVDHVKKRGLYASTDYQEIFEQGPFDIIVCNDVIEHVDQPIKIVSEISSLMKDGSVLHAAVPRFTKKDIKKSVRLMEKGKRLKAFHLGHINYLTPQSFEKIMRDYDLRPINAQTLTLPWVGGLNKADLREFAKSAAKLFLYNFGTKYCNTWIK